MPQIDSDRNLLFGVLALQIDAIDQSQFVDACAIWAGRKDQSLAGLLSERGWLSVDDRAEVERLVQRKLKRLGGDARAGLAEVTGEVVQRSLAAISDPEVRRSIGLPDAAAGHVLVSTIGYDPGSRDRYTLTRIHAQGGIGRVWLARDESLGREVALKELRPEQAGRPTLWARFLEEARITGQLEHPNIVPVHELSGVGVEGDRKPFYTMRFVKGRTLSDASRAYHARRAERQAGPLELRELLQAFVGVCQALAYAHSRGVIHRDLKGQNVVLGDFGEVIVLDWGLAKLIGRAEETLTPQVALEHPEDRGETLQGQALGTPGYMSPEQAEGRWDLVDRHTDVYGLGAILYEVLSGQPPFDGPNTAEVLRRVVTEAPRRPGAISDGVPKALEAVCLKALAKSPGDRQDSVEALADDVKRWMADEPVSAYPEPFSKRAGRWARRHKPLLAGAAVLLVAAVLALSVGNVLLSRANARTESERRRAESLRLTAEANFQKAREAVDEYFTKVSQSKLLNVPGLQPLRKELLESSRKYYQEFLEDHASDPSVRAEAAESWYRVGFVTMVVDTPREAMDAFQKAAEMYDRLVLDHPGVERYPYKLAMTLNDLGNQQAALGLEAEARESHGRCLAIREQVARDHPDVPEYRKELGIGYSVWSERQFIAGLTSESLRMYERARDVFEGLVREYPKVADYRWRLGGCLADIASIEGALGHPAESMQMHLQALSQYEQLVREHLDVLDYQKSLSAAHNSVGWAHYRLFGRNAEALEAIRKAREVAEKMARDNPDLASAHAWVASLDQEIGRVLARLGRSEEALTHYKKAVDYQKKRESESPGGVWDRRTLGYLHYEIGRILSAAGRAPDASEELARAQTIFEEVAESNAIDPYNRACAQALCAGLVGLGKTPLSAEDEARRRRFATKAVATLREAASGGYQSVEILESDIDFEAIRMDDDFRALLTELRASQKPRAQPGTEAGK